MLSSSLRAAITTDTEGVSLFVASPRRVRPIAKNIMLSAYRTVSKNKI